MNSMLLLDVVVMIAGVIYWNSSGPLLQPFKKELFLYGAIASMMWQISQGFCLQALTTGPQGPVCSIILASTLLLVIVEAIRNRKFPTWIELLSLVVGFIGALEMILPECFEKLFCCKKTISENDPAKTASDE